MRIPIRRVKLAGIAGLNLLGDDADVRAAISGTSRHS